MFTDISCESRDNEEEFLANANLVSQVDSKANMEIVDTPCSRFGNDWNYFSHNFLCNSVTVSNLIETTYELYMTRTNREA